MRSFSIFAAGITLLLAAGSLTASSWAQTPPARAPREVNVTTDSAPGWIPSVELEQAARAAAERYLASRDAGRAADAYGQLDPINAKDMPFSAFSSDLSKFNAMAGAVKDRRVIKLTWTKDPASAPARGIYAAFDLVSHFAAINRHCGYIVLRQAPAGGPFRVMREDSTFMDDAAAAGQSKAAADAAWSQISAKTCPNYRADEAPRVALGSPPPPLPESGKNTTGYASVAAALAGLHAKPGITFSTQNGWMIAADTAALTVWSFAPIGHPAYPAVVKRQAVQDAGGTSLQMEVLCEASKAACDELVRTFQQLSERAVGGRR
jgi:hypothetical protein